MSDDEVEIIAVLSRSEAMREVEKRFKWAKRAFKDASCSICFEKTVEIDLLIVESHSYHCKTFTCAKCFQEWSEQCRKNAQKITCPCCRRIATHTRKAEHIHSRQKIRQPIIRSPRVAELLARIALLQMYYNNVDVN